MKRFLAILFISLLSSINKTKAQTHPAITKWLINTTNITGRHYVTGNSTPINDTAKANVQSVSYSANYVYVRSTGIPAYVVGPYQDGNPSLATDRKFLFKIPLNPVENTGTPTAVGLGQIGVLINGVPVYNYADARSYNNQGIWHQNAVVFERLGFDCSKGHPSPVFSGPTLVGGTYHHHQNPSAFNVASVQMSTVCNVYLADGLYVPDSTTHGPLIGFAWDGYPIYGAYGYANTNGTGGIKRMKPSFNLRNITARTTLADGTVLSSSQYGPALSTYALGAYSEDYDYTAGSGDLDEHNGRFCVTPEYPSGTYAYFATIDANGNSVYPYVIGPTYKGVIVTANFTPPGGGNSTSVTITEPVTPYNPGTLPVTLLKFYGETLTEGNMLNWITQTEKNSDHFELERSNNGYDFKTVGLVKSKGNTNAATTYSYLDSKPIYELNYYKLKMVDRDGKSNYSNTILLKKNSIKNYNIKVYPNPATDLLVIQSNEAMAVNRLVELISMDGKIVKRETLYQGSTMCYFDLQTVYTGTYIIKISDGSNIVTSKVVITN